MSFDPTQPFEVETAAGGFDPSQPFEVESSSKGPRSRPTNPNRGLSSRQLAGKGAFKFLNDMSLGRRQIMTNIAGLVGLEGAEDEQRTLEGIADARKLDPVMQTTAGQVGYTGAALVPALAASVVPGANTVIGGGLIGGGMGFMQPTGTDDSRLLNTGGGFVAGAAGQGAANAIGRVAQPVKKAGGQMYRRAVETLSKADVPLTPAQQTGSGVLAQAQRYVTNNPITQPKEAARIGAQRQGYTRAVLKKIGVRADVADETAMLGANTRIGGVFDDIGARYELDLNAKPTLDRFVEIADEAKDTLMQESNPITKMADDIITQSAKNGGKLPAGTYQKFKTQLDRYARDPKVQPFAVDLRKVLDDALLKATEGTDDFARLSKARKDYANLKAIENAIDAEGQISPAKLWNQFTTARRKKQGIYGMGDQELARLARSGKQILVEKMPDSGTGPRQWLQALGPQAVAAAGAAATGNPLPALGIAASAYGLPKLTQAAIGRNYLATGLQTPALRNALMAPSRSGLVGAAVPAYLLAQQ